MKTNNGSKLWEKVAAGFLALFAIREGARTINSCVSWVFLVVVFACILLYFLAN